MVSVFRDMIHLVRHQSRTLSAENSDAWLMTKVKTSLLFHRSVSVIKTEVLAEDGIVTLLNERTEAKLF